MAWASIGWRHLRWPKLAEAGLAVARDLVVGETDPPLALVGLAAGIAQQRRQRPVSDKNKNDTVKK